MAPISSLLLIDKPIGVTSFSSLTPIKRNLEKKVGHAGTLDKFAHGLMIVLTGNMTKLNSIFSSLDKKYEATFEFGKMTDTLDPEGNIIETSGIPTIDEIQKAISEYFIGTIAQVPPKYSAIHINGKRAYHLVRDGKEVELNPRDITIYSIEISSYNPPFLKLKIHCSKGTYVRSLARDIAFKVNSVAYVTELVRTHIGPYRLTDAIKAEDENLLKKSISNSEQLLLQLPYMGTIIIEDKAVVPLSHGNLPKNEYIVEKRVSSESRYAIIYSKDNVMLAIVSLNEMQEIVSSIAILQ